MLFEWQTSDYNEFHNNCCNVIELHVQLLVQFNDAYVLCEAAHVQEVVAGHIASLSVLAVVAGHTVVPAVMARGAPVIRSRNHRSVSVLRIRQNVDLVRRHVNLVRRSRMIRPMTTTMAAGMRVRSAILRLLTDDLVVNDKLSPCTLLVTPF